LIVVNGRVQVRSSLTYFTFIVGSIRKLESCEELDHIYTSQNR
jgi:hypothetical protein